VTSWITKCVFKAKAANHFFDAPHFHLCAFQPRSAIKQPTINQLIFLRSIMPIFVPTHSSCNAHTQYAIPKLPCLNTAQHFMHNMFSASYLVTHIRCSYLVTYIRCNSHLQQCNARSQIGSQNRLFYMQHHYVHFQCCALYVAYKPFFSCVLLIVCHTCFFYHLY